MLLKVAHICQPSCGSVQGNIVYKESNKAVFLSPNLIRGIYIEATLDFPGVLGIKRGKGQGSKVSQVL